MSFFLSCLQSKSETEYGEITFKEKTKQRKNTTRTHTNNKKENQNATFNLFVSMEQAVEQVESPSSMRDDLYHVTYGYSAL